MFGYFEIFQEVVRTVTFSPNGRQIRERRPEAETAHPTPPGRRPGLGERR